MVNEVNLAISLYCHHGRLVKAWHDVEIMKRVSFEKGMPITYFVSGQELEKIAQYEYELAYSMNYNVVSAIKNTDTFINPKWGHSDAHKSELGIMPYNHIPLVHPFDESIWGIYFDGILRDQILWSKGIAENKFGRTPVSIHPPDGIYSPAAAGCIRNCGLDTVVVPGEHMWNPHDKGVLYWASDLRHVVRANDIQIEQHWDAKEFIDRVESHAYEHNLHFVTVGLDSDSLPSNDMIARLCCIGDEAYRRGVNLINVNAVAHWNQWQTRIEDAWGDWNSVHSMLNGEGNLDFIQPGKNAEVGHVVKLIAQRYHEAWDDGTIRYAKHRLWEAADEACRSKGWAEHFSDHYQGNINEARNALQG